QVVYVTATVPYIFLTILLIRGCMLPGALDGIIFFLKPDFKKLMDPKVWAEACLQIFYSLGPTWGGLIAMSRYNKFNNNCLKDSVVICLVCCGTSFYSGFICFSIIGFMAHNIGTNVSDVITTGPGLVFNVYPEAIAQLPISPFWSICFFIMLLTLGLDSLASFLFGMIESCTNGVVDEFPKFLKPRKTRLTLIVCVMFFLLGIPLCSGAGIYIFQILDWYAAAFTAMIIAILECIVLGHIYGANKLFDHITEMMNRRPSLWWKICWCYITPLIMLALLIYSCVQMKPPTYGSYVYPSWSVALGWIVSMFSIVPIPIYAIHRLSAEEGSLMEVTIVYNFIFLLTD
ncbi:hypothetical protein HELRODRAFT_71249, partial [Helobdella robusta]|uniref:Transporter n=1 Tax=Helobdella robusta TaxID=6412 RepID=T1G0I4_HELRO